MWYSIPELLKLRRNCEQHTKIEEYIEQEGILGISGAIFKEHTSPKGKLIKVNSTVEKHCTAMATIQDCTVEEYAEELYNCITAEGKLVVGECEECWAFIVEGEKHVCSPLQT